MGFENPPYEILERDGHFELRQYDDYIVAEVTVEDGFDEALTRGFRILADYIFGNNRRSEHTAMTVPVTEQPRSESEKISMTAPVTSQPQGSGTHRIAFMMPSKYSLETLPQPTDARISFRTVDAHKAAATRFSGSMNESSAATRRAELAEWLASKNLSTDLPFAYANYSPPWIPPFLRRNEVMAELP
ncbi:heme-binding protein [Chloroflexota bacterium]